MELLNCENENRLRPIFRMRKATLLNFCVLLRTRGNMRDSRNSTTVERKFIQFLHIIDGMTLDKVSERFQCSKSSTSIWFKEVLNAINLIAPSIIRSKYLDGGVPTEIRSNPKFYPYFKDAVGAIDGSHIPVHVSNEDRSRYRN